MAEFKILLYVVILIISLISIISNSSKKKSNKKKAEDILSKTEAHRTLTQDESEQINKLYKGNGSVEPGAEVFKVNGEYSFTELRTRGSSIKNHFINHVEVLLLPELELLLTENNSAEIVFNKRGVGVILNLNESYAVTKEVSFSKELEGNIKLDSDTESISAQRKLTDIEVKFLNSDIKVLSGLLLFVSFLIPIISVNTTTLVVSGILFISSVLLFIKKKNPKHIDDNKLIKISGVINENAHGVYHIGRFKLNFPKNVNPEVGSNAEIEAYSLDDRAYENRVLSFNSTWSVNSEYQFKELNKKGNKIYFITILSLIIAILLFSSKGVSGLSGIKKHINTMNSQTTFKSIKKLKEYKLVPQQSLTVTGDKTIFSFSKENSLYLIDKDLDIKVDNDLLKKRYNLLKEIQRTELFFQLVSIFMVSDSDAADFRLDNGSIILDQDLKVFENVFSNNPHFLFFMDFWPKFLNNEIEPDYTKLENNFNDFFKFELDFFKSEINKAILDQLEGRDYLEIGYDYNKYYDFNEHILTDEDFRQFYKINNFGSSVKKSNFIKLQAVLRFIDSGLPSSSEPLNGMFINLDGNKLSITHGLQIDYLSHYGNGVLFLLSILMLVLFILSSYINKNRRDY